MDINRDSFLEENAEVGDLDLLSNQLYRDVWPETGMKFIVQSTDVARPDLMAARILGAQELWWVLLKYNDIDDPWNELYPGQVLKIPDDNAIRSYSVNHKVR